MYLRMNTRTTKHQGFTLIELLVALSIGTMIILMAGLVFTQGVRHARAIAGETKLIEAAAHFTNVLTYEIRQATAVNTASAGTLHITRADTSTRSIVLSGDEIVREDGTPILPDNISANVLTFTVVDNQTVQVHYTLHIDTGIHPDFSVPPFAATTTVALRNH